MAVSKRIARRRQRTISFFDNDFTNMSRLWKYAIIWLFIIVLDSMLEFRLEYIWSLWLFVNHITHFVASQGTIMTIGLVLSTFATDFLVYILLPSRILLLSASTYIWLSYSWLSTSDRVIPTFSVLLLFCFIEGWARMTEVRLHHLCRLLAAHSLGYSIILGCIRVRKFITGKIEQRTRQKVQEKNSKLFKYVFGISETDNNVVDNSQQQPPHQLVDEAYCYQTIEQNPTLFIQQSRRNRYRDDRRNHTLLIPLKCVIGKICRFITFMSSVSVWRYKSSSSSSSSSSSQKHNINRDYNNNNSLISNGNNNNNSNQLIGSNGSNSLNLSNYQPSSTINGNMNNDVNDQQMMMSRNQSQFSLMTTISKNNMMKKNARNRNRFVDRIPLEDRQGYRTNRCTTNGEHIAPYSHLGERMIKNKGGGKCSGNDRNTNKNQNNGRRRTSDELKDVQRRSNLSSISHSSIRTMSSPNSTTITSELGSILNDYSSDNNERRNTNNNNNNNNSSSDGGGDENVEESDRLSDKILTYFWRLLLIFCFISSCGWRANDSHGLFGLDSKKRNFFHLILLPMFVLSLPFRLIFADIASRYNIYVGSPLSTSGENVDPLHHLNSTEQTNKHQQTDNNFICCHCNCSNETKDTLEGREKDIRKIKSAPPQPVGKKNVNHKHLETVEKLKKSEFYQLHAEGHPLTRSISQSTFNQLQIEVKDELSFDNFKREIIRKKAIHDAKMAKKNMKDMEAQLGRLKDELAKTKRSLENEHQSKLELKSKLKEFNENRETNKNELKSIQTTLNIDRNQFNQEKKKLQEKYEDLQKKFDEEKGKSDKLKNNSQSFYKTIDDLTLSNKICKDDLKRLSGKTKEKDDEIVELQKKLTNLTNDLNAEIEYRMLLFQEINKYSTVRSTILTQTEKIFKFCESKVMEQYGTCHGNFELDSSLSSIFYTIHNYKREIWKLFSTNGHNNNPTYRHLPNMTHRINDQPHHHHHHHHHHQQQPPVNDRRNSYGNRLNNYFSSHNDEQETIDTFTLKIASSASIITTSPSLSSSSSSSISPASIISCATTTVNLVTTTTTSTSATTYSAKLLSSQNRHSHHNISHQVATQAHHSKHQPKHQKYKNRKHQTFNLDDLQKDTYFSAVLHRKNGETTKSNDLCNNNHFDKMFEVAASSTTATTTTSHLMNGSSTNSNILLNSIKSVSDVVPTPLPKFTEATAISKRNRSNFDFLLSTNENINNCFVKGGDIKVDAFGDSYKMAINKNNNNNVPLGLKSKNEHNYDTFGNLTDLYSSNNEYKPLNGFHHHDQSNQNGNNNNHHHRAIGSRMNSFHPSSGAQLNNNNNNSNNTTQNHRSQKSNYNLAFSQHSSQTISDYPLKKAISNETYKIPSISPLSPSANDSPPTILLNPMTSSSLSRSNSSESSIFSVPFENDFNDVPSPTNLSNQFNNKENQLDTKLTFSEDNFPSNDSILSLFNNLHSNAPTTITSSTQLNNNNNENEQEKASSSNCIDSQLEDGSL
ncbi:hypothetical protein SNEBB_008187 [Seison nebaliae]|nr:hypothetical protein SNEBB_008187 [Seison nebaliae]